MHDTDPNKRTLNRFDAFDTMAGVDLSLSVHRTACIPAACIHVAERVQRSVCDHIYASPLRLRVAVPRRDGRACLMQVRSQLFYMIRLASVSEAQITRCWFYVFDHLN
jgi:hypothetical protein